MTVRLRSFDRPGHQSPDRPKKRPKSRSSAGRGKRPSRGPREHATHTTVPGRSRVAGSRTGTDSATGPRGSSLRYESTRGSSPRASSPQALLTTYRPDIAQALARDDTPAYRYTQVCEHLFSPALRPFSLATALPASMRDNLDELRSSVLTAVDERTAEDGTWKCLLACEDGATIETVLMRYRDRVTACISSQAGCPVGCLFCATGAMGFRRNLTAAEIVDQVRIVRDRATRDGLRLSNLVFMGMGEPLLNLHAVLDSILVLTDPYGLDLSHRALSVSTVGIPGAIRHLAKVQPQVHLALSLHTSDDQLRATLIPSRFCHPIDDVLGAAWEHFSATGRKLLVEYVLLGGVNDSVADAQRLASLLRGHVVAVNLLAWNPVRVTAAGASPRFRIPTASAVSAFRRTLVDSRVETVVRRSKGGGIEAACGQLAGLYS